MRPKRWVFARTDRAAGERLARALNISGVTATLLVNRGLRDPAEARRFLSPELSGLLDPLSFEDMGRAMDRLEAALRGGEKIGIFGDYDVDGASGTAILVKLFGLLGHPVSYRVPHRVRDGYGVNAGAVEAFAREGVRVLLTVDCGTRDLEALARARTHGMDVIVLDHHEPGPVLPPVLALLNPKRPGSSYGFTGLCSSGIAFKLAWALADRAAARRRPGFDGFILDAMGLAALGTVADVCPLTGENRVFVRYGLPALRACRGRGLRALLGRTGLEGRPLDTFDVSFKLAPRLNALGRLGSAMDCVELLVTEDGARVEAVLDLLERSNRDRKGIEDEIFEQACAQVEAVGGAQQPALVVADERWHVGVVGIVAARLVERYHRPAFVLAVENGVARGSARSVDGWPLHEALAECGDLLLTHGGHAMAAGLSLRTENLDPFRRRILRRAERDLTPERLEPRLEVDDEVSLGSVTRPVVREIERLAPHGPGNPPPLLAATHVRVAGEPRLMGRRHEHLSVYLAQNGVSVRAVGFRMAGLGESLRRTRTVSVVFTPEISSWQGHESVELHLRDLKLGDD